MSLKTYITKKFKHPSAWNANDEMTLSFDANHIREQMQKEYFKEYILKGEPILSFSETHFFVTFETTPNGAPLGIYKS